MARLTIVNGNKGFDDATLAPSCAEADHEQLIYDAVIAEVTVQILQGNAEAAETLLQNYLLAIARAEPSAQGSGSS